jgi:predicted TIM-barrel fold metal-dependent hydrolase
VYRGAVHAIDFHTHAFPDNLYEKAIHGMSEHTGLKPALDGSIRSLLESMDAAGIEKSVVLSIATKPSQFEPILEWSGSIASNRIVPFPSVHPADPDSVQKIRIARQEGFKGMKFHPYYQGFELDGEIMNPIYEAMEKHGLICVCHAGFDYAFPFDRIADPPRIKNVLRKFPGLTFVAAHLGAWKDWDLVAEHLTGERLFVDISFSLNVMPADKARELIRGFAPDRVLFGTDSPWDGQASSIALLRGLGLGEEREKAILSENAMKLLGA